MISQVLLLVVSPVYPPLIPPPICLPPCAWALPPATLPHILELCISQFSSLTWLKTNITRRRKKKAIILRLVSWIKEGLVNAKSGTKKDTSPFGC